VFRKLLMLYVASTTWLTTPSCETVTRRLTEAAGRSGTMSKKTKKTKKTKRKRKGRGGVR
jgi:hypothetical protein